MAVTRILKIHGKADRNPVSILKDRIGYGLDSEKTKDSQFISSYACDIDTSASEFAIAHRQYETLAGRKHPNDVLAYQIRQSFKPGEVTPEEANAIGYELAERYLKGKFAFVVATHIDKAHIHNHIYFNAINLDCKSKHRDRKGSAKDIARLSDLICIEHNLSTIVNPQKGNTAYNKWEGYKAYLSHRDLLRNDIDDVLNTLPKDFDVFLELMKEKGYEIRLGKYLSFKKSTQERFIRLSSLCEGYLEDDIRLMITEKKTRNKKSKVNKPLKSSLLIDVQKKLDEGKGQGYANWAKVFNLKQMAKTVMFLQENDYEDIEKLNQQVNELSAEISELKENIKAAESRLAELAALKTQIINYAKTKEVFEQYKASGYSKKFLEEHESEIILHKAAKKAFDELGVKKLPTIKLINKEFNDILQSKRADYEEYHELKKKHKELLVHNANISFILSDKSEKERDKTVSL